MVAQGPIDAVDSGEIYSRPGGSFELIAWCGTSIDRVCRDAAKWASEHTRYVYFDFNGVRVIAQPEVSAKSLEDYWRREFERKGEEYRNSPEAKAQAELDRLEDARCQCRVEAIVSTLPEIVSDEASLIDTLSELSDVGDRIGVSFDRAAVAELLETVWERNACVGMEPEAIRANKTLIARYIIGQAIDHLRHQMPPHPVIQKFAEAYRQMA